MLLTGVVTLEEFMARYPPHLPRREHANEDELKLLSAADGVIVIAQAPVAGVSTHAHPHDTDAGQATHLWVFLETSIPAILELAVVSPPLESGRAKHTNLTGGGKAACGGELWVDPVDHSKLYVNGGSGRYGPTTPVQLDDAIGVFRSRGYEVVSFGWAEENDEPARVLRDV